MIERLESSETRQIVDKVNELVDAHNAEIEFVAGFMLARLDASVDFRPASALEYRALALLIDQGLVALVDGRPDLTDRGLDEMRGGYDQGPATTEENLRRIAR